jgi:hypothetical protein
MAAFVDDPMRLAKTIYLAVRFSVPISAKSNIRRPSETHPNSHQNTKLFIPHMMLDMLDAQHRRLNSVA